MQCLLSKLFSYFCCIVCKEMPVSKRVFQLKHLCWRLVSPECTLSTSRLQRSRCKTRAGSSKSKTKPPAAFLLLVSTTAFVICLGLGLGLASVNNRLVLFLSQLLATLISACDQVWAQGYWSHLAPTKQNWRQKMRNHPLPLSTLIGRAISKYLLLQIQGCIHHFNSMDTTNKGHFSCL